MKVQSVFYEMQRLISPHCWGAPQVTPGYSLRGLPDQVEVEAVLKASSDAATPAEARAALFDAAQAAVAAVEKAGYRHTRAPDISIAGDVHDVYRPGGPTVIADGRLTLNLWRPGEERP